MSIERWLGAIAGLAVGLALLYYMYGPQIQDLLPHPAPAPVAAAPEPAPAPAAEGPQYPVPEAPEPQPAPAPAQPEATAPAETPPADLAESDAGVRKSLAQVFGDAAVDTFLVRQRVIERIVVTIDSLDRDPVPLRMRAISELPELPIVEKEGDTLTLGDANGERYRLLVDALARADTKAIAALYLREYPLFQRAYRELGYPTGYFNDRLVAVIDHLLATPEPAGPLRLVRPKVLYQYADPQLEALSSGQKALLRIGGANRAVVKGKLRELRAIVAARAKKPAAQ